MGQFIWILAGAAAVGGVIGLSKFSNPEHMLGETETPVVEETIIVARQDTALDVGSRGSALAVAAFGLAALQPDTYDGQLVLEIIDASHLDASAKRALERDLEAAEAGRADLDDVLEDVRVALAVE
ncbi:MAG: hypothetical protein KJO42_08780 [Silicimonas sp.]|nr:hypothetical protein [Silicimonas sp.]MBT8425670.1 hypothetical protein [Silicimonas sp.]NND42047.1 hypothetical protein [Silicimonas sp.]